MKKAHSPGKRWWIKADACDLGKGLRELGKGKWAGDQDHGDGVLKSLEKEYDQRRAFCPTLGSGHRECHLQEDLHLLLFAIESDTIFLQHGDQKASELYEKRRRTASSSQTVLIALAWDVVGFEDLSKEATRFLV